MGKSVFNNIVTPSATAKAVTHEALLTVVNQIVRGQLLFFANTTDRDTQIAAALTRGVTLGEGALSYLAASDRYESWNGSSWVPLVGDILGYGRRETSSSATTTEVGVLRLDNMAIESGRMLRVYTNSAIIWGSTAAGDLIEGRLRYSTSGAATTASTQFSARADNSRTASGSQFTNDVSAVLPSPGDATLSVLLSVARTAGSGSVSFPASATYPIELLVVDIGRNPGNTGVAI